MSVDETSRDCVRSALCALAPILANGDKENDAPNGTGTHSAADYQLWVKTKAEEAPYPLIGHEVPLVIKLHWTRQAFNSRNGERGGKSFDEYKAGYRCSFILR